MDLISSVVLKSIVN